MSEVARILALWQEATTSGEEWVLATVVRVEGSSYRKPGARMLITATGRAGTISGGCLEAEVVRKAFWLTRQGPRLESYQSTFDEDGSAPFGLGCGGTVFILLERGESGDAVLRALQQSMTQRTSFAIVTVIDTNSKLLSRRVTLSGAGRPGGELQHEAALMTIAERTMAEQGSRNCTVKLNGKPVEVFAEYMPRATSLIVFGAGDDARPVVDAASALGWLTTIADGRANLIRPERFPSANLVVNTDANDPLSGLDISHADAVVIMTHSYEQDRVALTALLQTSIAYIGVLGPRRRTAQLVADAASATGLDPEVCMQRLHAPVGLDLGADSPAGIALEIVAEIHAALRAKNTAHSRGHDVARQPASAQETAITLEASA